MINYRSIKDLNRVIVRGLSKLPRDIGLVVGIPRSGLLAATIVALHLNLPLTDLEGFLEGRLIQSGARLRKFERDHTAVFNGKTLIVDDSVLLGNAIRQAKQRIDEANRGHHVIYCAIFVSSRGRSAVDLYFEEIRGNRVFEWNFMHSWIVRHSCVDIDGVLCEDPTDEQNDDGERYERFVLGARPLWVPSEKVGYLVTCRLEKYRSLTAQWLQRHAVHYGKLIMMDFPTKEARQASGKHAAFKADVYKSTDTLLFIESSSKQAREIARVARKPVLCVETQQMIYPSLLPYAINQLPNAPNFIYHRLRNYASRLKRRLLDIDPPNK